MYSLPLNQFSYIIKGSISSLACNRHSYSYVDVQSVNQLNQLNLCFRLVPFVHFGSSIRQLFINCLQEVPSRTLTPRLLYSHHLGQAYRKIHHLPAFVQALISSAHFCDLERQTFISLSDLYKCTFIWWKY